MCSDIDGYTPPLLVKMFFLLIPDVDDFIVDDDGNPIKHAKKKRRVPGTVKDS